MVRFMNKHLYNFLSGPLVLNVVKATFSPCESYSENKVYSGDNCRPHESSQMKFGLKILGHALKLTFLVLILLSFYP